MEGHLYKMDFDEKIAEDDYFAGRLKREIVIS